MVPFTLASRKHYTLDVITSLYVTTLMYELGSLKYPDKTEDGDMAEVGIVYGEEEGERLDQGQIAVYVVTNVFSRPSSPRSAPLRVRYR